MLKLLAYSSLWFRVSVRYFRLPLFHATFQSVILQTAGYNEHECMIQ